MPLYDGISSLGLISEKHTAVIFDFGSAYTKVGFAGETGPRAIVPSIIECPTTKRLVPVFEGDDPEVLRHRLVAFVHKLYIRCLLVNPKERRVVVVENILSRSIVKDTIAAVLFRHYEVISVAFVPSHVVSLMCLGVTTALVVDIGHTEASVLPVYEDVPILHAWQALPLGSKRIQENLKELLLERSTLVGVEKVQLSPESLTDDVLEDITVRCCFVSSPERSGRLCLNRIDRSNEPPAPPPEVVYPFSGASALKIPGTVRELAPETLFECDADNLSLTHMILDAIISCPVDVRHSLAANLFFVGGTSMLTGLKRRILHELRSLSARPIYAQKMAPPTFKIHSPPVKENFVAWLGGCIIGSSEGGVVPRSVTREQYVNLLTSRTPLPDWSSLAHNTNDNARAPA